MLQKRFEKSVEPFQARENYILPLSVETLTFSLYINWLQIGKSSSELPFDKIKGFVTCAYDGHWWLACVLETNTEELEVS